ncbi:MAG: SPFH domain-containing protein [Bryobacteraceae bacterium]|jgi:regulator of protease activity HflC (stomatin/prohibitin superfamily)
MVLLRYLLVFTGIGLLIGAAGILIWDLIQIVKYRRQAPGSQGEAPPPALRWSASRQLAMFSVLPLLVGLSIAVVPGGAAGVRVNQFLGIRPRTLYPGVHWILPLVEQVEIYNIRDNVYTTTAVDDPKKLKQDAVLVQTREGLMVGLAVSVRYRLDPSKLPYIHANLPQPLEEEMVAPTVSSTFRDLAPGFLVREMFSTRREEIRRAAANGIMTKLAADGIVVKEVVIRDIQLPTEYAKGLEGLLLKEQENERMNVELEVKKKLVQTAELEAEALKAREVTEAEARAQVVVLEAKAQADAMQHTLPLKEKQIQQSKLEAEARKESTVRNAEAMASAKIIDSKAELEKRNLMSDGEEYRIRRLANADAERMKLEAAVLKDNPLLIQKIIAEKLSDKVQIMMVPNDGKFFFANDVLKGLTPASAITH